MHKVGIVAENGYAMCSPQEMLGLFFWIKHNGGSDMRIIDRLYRRYLTLEQLESVLPLLRQFEKSSRGGDHTLFGYMRRAVEESLRFHTKFHEYVPVRMGIPELCDDRFRDLSEYDNLDGPPFWLREYLQEYPNAELPF